MFTSDVCFFSAARTCLYALLSFRPASLRAAGRKVGRREQRGGRRREQRGGRRREEEGGGGRRREQRGGRRKEEEGREECRGRGPVREAMGKGRISQFAQDGVLCGITQSCTDVCMYRHFHVPVSAREASACRAFSRREVSVWCFFMASSTALQGCSKLT